MEWEAPKGQVRSSYHQLRCLPTRRVGKYKGTGDWGSGDPLVTSVLWNYKHIYTFLYSCYIPLLSHEVNAGSQLMLVLAA